MKITFIIIVLLLILLLIKNKIEKFSYNPLTLLGITDLRDLTDFRKCNQVRNKSACILNGIGLKTTPNRDRLPIKLHKNYTTSMNVKDLYPYPHK